MKAHTWSSGLHRAQIPIRVWRNVRFTGVDSRNRLSNFWAPTGGISPQDGEEDDSHALLVRGGFLRQAHSGVFHLLPLGLRVQTKLEALIDQHMSSLGASKVSLSSISTEALWRQSGRYSSNPELLRLNDRKESGFLLSPTHEEEITSLVAGMVHSYKDLPLRLYQIGRKYRDERRPRGGLLRAKEFLMKDLYTFDYCSPHALETYQAVRKAYNALFDELKVPYLVADADSGNMGGKLSHEYHFVSPKGEDNVWSCSCSSCDYVANEELVEKKSGDTAPVGEDGVSEFVFHGITADRTQPIDIHIARPTGSKADHNPGWEDIHSFVNLHAAKRLANLSGLDLGTGIGAQTLQSLLKETSKEKLDIYDQRVIQEGNVLPVSRPDGVSYKLHVPHTMDITPTLPGAPCPRCASGTLGVQKAIEVGHTFHLGTRYSEPLNAFVAVSSGTEKVPIQMGSHGIGVSRLIGAIACLLSDERGLNWPKVIAPFDAVVITTPKVSGEDEMEVYDALQAPTTEMGSVGVDSIVDDRPINSLGWKLKDADLIGYPVLVVLGRAWKEKKAVEVQCRRLGVRTEVGLKDLRSTVLELLEKL